MIVPKFVIEKKKGEKERQEQKKKATKHVTISKSAKNPM